MKFGFQSSRQEGQAVGPPDTPDISDTKTCKVQALPSIAPLPMTWTPDEYEGRPCCWLPVPLPKRLRGLGLDDLRGFGIPAEGLPSTLRPFSRNGWRLRLDATGAVEMVAGPRATRENGCRAYLRAMRDKVAEHLKLWQEGAVCV